MNKHISNFLENNWDELKEKIQTQWDKLTNDDLEQIAGSSEQLINKLKKTYHLKVDEIENEILTFLSNNNLIPNNESKKSKNNNSSFIKNANINFENYLDYIKDKSLTLEKSTKKHIQTHPLKWLSIAALSGFVLAKFIRL